MTISTTARRVSYAGDASTLTFAVPFAFFLVTDLRAFKRNSAGTETAMTISSSTGGNGSTGTVTLSAVVGVGNTLFIERVTPKTQETDYTPNDPFPAQTHERALDKLTLLIQDASETLGRAIIAPPSDDMTSISLEMPKAADRADKVLAFDADGNVTVATQDPGSANAAGLYWNDGYGNATTIESKLRDGAVSVKTFGAVGDGVTDDSVAIQAAIDAAAVVHIPAGTYIIGTALTTHDGLTIYGDGSRTTILQAAGTNLVFDADGGYRTAGGQQLKRFNLEDLRIRGNAGTTLHGMRLKGAALCNFKRVDFFGFDGRQLLLDEVFDSWFEECYFLNSYSTAHPALKINFGSGDSSNNLRFISCTWETQPYQCVEVSSGPSAPEANYNISFIECKFEAGTTGAASPVAQFLVNGTGGFTSSKITFSGGLIVPESNSVSWFEVASGVSMRMLSFSDIYIPYRGALTNAAPVFKVINTKEFYLNRIKSFGPALPSPYIMADVGGAGNDQFYADDVIYNGLYIDPFNGTRPATSRIKTGPNRLIGAFRNDGDVAINGDTLADGDMVISQDGASPILRARRLSGGVLGVAGSGYVDIQVDSSGIGQVVSQAGTGASTVCFELISGRTRFDSTWNGLKFFQIGTYRHWYDSLGYLRRKSSDPSSEFDGDIVGPFRQLVITRTGSSTANASYDIYRYTGGGGHTETLSAALGNAHIYTFRNSGTGNWTIARAGADVIDNGVPAAPVTSVTLTPGQILKICDTIAGRWETV